MDTEEIFGLDQEEEINIYIQNKEGDIYTFEEKQLKFIELIQTIIKSDTYAGRTRDNPIRLPLLDTSIFDLIINYIKKHGDNDYKARDNSNGTDLMYSDRMTLWDRNFFNEIALSDKKNNTGNLAKLLDASAYLMYNTLYSKICCFLANTESGEDYQDIFRQLSLIR